MSRYPEKVQERDRIDLFHNTRLSKKRLRLDFITHFGYDVGVYWGVTYIGRLIPQKGNSLWTATTLGGELLESAQSPDVAAVRLFTHFKNTSRKEADAST